MKFTQRLKNLFSSRKTKPQYNLDIEIYKELEIFRLPLIFIVLMMFFGSVGYMVTADFGLMDAIYQAGMTFTTVGFTEVAHIGTAGRFFTIAFILMGFCLFTFAIGIVVEVLKQGTLIKLLKERKMLHKIARLKNHFVLCYHNALTANLAREFKENQTPFVVVDPSANLEELAKEHGYSYFVKAQPHTKEALLKSFMSSAKGVITLSQNAADNIAMIAVVRAYDEKLIKNGSRKKPFFVMTNAAEEEDTERLIALGANSVVLPSKLVAQKMAAVSAKPDMQNLLDKFLHNQNALMDIEEIAVPTRSWLRFKRLRDAKIRELTNVTVIGIYDQDGNFTPMPRGNALIGTEARLLVIGSAKNIRQARELVLQKTRPSALQEE